MSATFESLIDSSTRNHAAPARRGLPRGRKPLADQEITEKVRPLAIIGKSPGDTLSGRVRQALVALRTGGHQERMMAARELGDIAMAGGRKIPEAVMPLIVSLAGDRDPHVRQEAAWSLWKLGDDRAHRPLIKALVGDPHTGVREKAARALGLMGASDAGRIMIDLLGLGRHVSSKLRAALAASLGLFGDKDALPLLMQAAADAEPPVRCESVSSLGRFLVNSPPSVTTRVFRKLARYAQAWHESQSIVRRAAVKALRYSNSAEANKVVAKVLICDPDPAVRELAAESLLLWNSALSEATLIKAIADDSWGVRKAAARALSAFVMRHQVYSSAAVCEALYRMERMFPSFSPEGRLAREARASL